MWASLAWECEGKKEVVLNLLSFASSIIISLKKPEEGNFSRSPYKAHRKMNDSSTRDLFSDYQWARNSFTKNALALQK